jgi:hypothetical protein
VLTHRSVVCELAAFDLQMHGPHDTEGLRERSPPAPVASTLPRDLTIARQSCPCGHPLPRRVAGIARIDCLCVLISFTKRQHRRLSRTDVGGEQACPDHMIRLSGGVCQFESDPGS